MGIVRTGESTYDKELAKWNTPKRAGGYQPDTPQLFPRMIYRAMKLESGKVVCMDLDPITNEPRSACYRIVKSNDELQRAQGEGWVSGSPKEALDAFERQEQALGQAAAEAIAAAKSEKAKRELDEVSNLTMEHVADVTPSSKKQLKHKAAEGLT